MLNENKNLLQSETIEEKVEVKKKFKKQIGETTHKVNVRSKPNLNSKIVRIAKRGEDLGEVKIVGEWVKVNDGYIKGDFVKLIDLTEL